MRVTSFGFVTTQEIHKQKQHTVKIPALHINGTGTPLIWMHGMLGSVESDSVYSLVDLHQLSQHVKLIQYNACDQAPDGDYSWPAMTNELSAVVHSLAEHHVLLGGISMGSGTALFTALRHPEKVKALILVTPPPAWEIRTPIQDLYEKIGQRAQPDRIPEFLKRIIQRNPDPPEFFEKHFPGTRNQLLQLRQGFHPAYYYSIYHGGAISDFPEREELARLRVPTFIVADPDDPNHPVKVAHELHSLISDSELHLVSNFEDYQEIQKNVSEFVKKHQANYDS